MKLLIAGKYIQIDDFVELISESPLINNFDTQYAQYSNSFEVKYSGDLVTLIDISKLRTTAAPYLTIDGFLIDGVIFIPVTIIINSFDPNKNTVKMNVSERFSSTIFGAIDIRTTKLTELRHLVDPAVGTGETDEIVLTNGAQDAPINEASILLTPPDAYSHAITPDNWCPIVDGVKFIAFLSARYGIVVTGAPAEFNFFANRQLPFFGDTVRGAIDYGIFETGPADVTYSPTALTDYPAGVGSDGFLISGMDTKLVKYKNKLGDAEGYFVSCKIACDFDPDPSSYSVYFKGVHMAYIGKSSGVMTFAITDKDTELDLNVGESGFESSLVIYFRVVCTEENNFTFQSFCRFNIDIPDNTAQATSLNSRQVFQNMPDVTIIDFFKTIAKANAQYLELTATGFKFVDIADSLEPGSIVDASPYLIEVKGISYTLYDSPALEYWYKDAATATLIVPIADSRVKSTAKKIEINMLRTDNDNVSLFEADGIKPLVGIATYAFMDITAQAASLEAFYLAIQNPFVVTASFRNFKLDLSNSVLIRQLNGLFVPKKIIKTNRDIIELELLKIEI